MFYGGSYAFIKRREFANIQVPSAAWAEHL